MDSSPSNPVDYIDRPQKLSIQATDISTLQRGKLQRQDRTSSLIYQEIFQGKTLSLLQQASKAASWVRHPAFLDTPPEKASEVRHPVFPSKLPGQASQTGYPVFL